MRAQEFVTEVLDRPWELVTNTVLTNSIRDAILRNGDGHGGLTVYQKNDDSSNIIFVIYYKNSWEVHHIYDSGENYLSGERLKPKNVGGLGNNINTGFVATAIKLYKELLDKGQSIRVTAPNNEHNLWDSYSKFINYWLKKNNDYHASIVINDISIQGTPQISQVISKYGTRWIEESLNTIEFRTAYNKLNYDESKKNIIAEYGDQLSRKCILDSFFEIAENNNYIKKNITWVAREYNNVDIDFKSLNESLYYYEWLRFKNNFPQHAVNINNMSLIELTKLVDELKNKYSNNIII